MLGSKEKHWLMSVRLFFSLAQSVPRPILFVHSFQNRSVWASQSHDIGLNYFLPFSESVSPIPLDDLERTAEKKKTYHRTPWTSTKSQKVFSCVIQPKLWEVKPAAIINILTHDVSSLFHQYPSCVLVFLTWNSGTTWGPISISPD